MPLLCLSNYKCCAFDNTGLVIEDRVMLTFSTHLDFTDPSKIFTPRVRHFVLFIKKRDQAPDVGSSDHSRKVKILTSCLSVMDVLDLMLFVE